MADTIFSVRVDEQIKGKFNELAKSIGINNKEFMEEILSFYELHKVSEESTINIQSDVNELQHITKRMIDIYINLVEGIKLANTEKDDKRKKALEEKEKEITSLKDSLEKELENKKGLENKIEAIKEEENNIVKKLKEQEELNNNFNALKKMQEDKIEELLNKLKEEEDNTKKIESLKKQITNLQEERNHVDTLLQNYKEENVGLKEKLQKEEELKKELKCSLEEQYQKDLSFIKEKEVLNKNSEILTLKENHYEKVSQLQTQIMDLINENKLLNNTIKELESSLKNINKNK